VDSRKNSGWPLPNLYNGGVKFSVAQALLVVSSPVAVCASPVTVCADWNSLSYAKTGSAPGLAKTISEKSYQRENNAFLKNASAFQARPNSLQNLTNEINLLQQSAKLGHGLSHFMLYVIYKNGIGTQQNLKLVSNWTHAHATLLPTEPNKIIPNRWNQNRCQKIFNRRGFTFVPGAWYPKIWQKLLTFCVC